MNNVTRLEWDSAFFGFAVGKINDQVTASKLRIAINEADESGFRCTYLLATADDHALLIAAQDLGFVVVDFRLELDRPIAGHPITRAGLRPAQPDDLPLLRELIRNRFRTTRFFADKMFPPDRSSELYDQWVIKGLVGESGWVTVVTDDACGFIVCKIDSSSGTGTIILIGVAEDASGTGVGASLIGSAGGLFADASLETAKVVTQGHNIAAQRLYQASGYRTREASYWLHRWRI